MSLTTFHHLDPDKTCPGGSLRRHPDKICAEGAEKRPRRFWEIKRVKFPVVVMRKQGKNMHGAEKKNTVRKQSPFS